MLSRLEPEVFAHNLAIHGISKQQWRRELRSQLLMEKALRLILRPGIRVTPNEIAAFYRTTVSEFHRPEQILAQHALLPSKPLGTEAGEPGARRYGHEPGRGPNGRAPGRGGQPTWLSRGHMPPGLEAKVFALSPASWPVPCPAPMVFTWCG